MRLTLLVLMPLLALAACADPDPAAPMSDETFIDVIVQLRRSVAQDTTQAAFDAARARILQQAGVTDSALLDYVRANAARVEHMAEIWDTIDVRLITPPDTTS